MSGPTEQEWEAALGAVTGAGAVALACHVGPDGDALGSMLGFGVALREHGTPVVASFAEVSGAGGAELPPAYSFLTGQDLLVPVASFPAEPELLVTFDTGSADRLGPLADRLPAARQTLVIDHHATNTRFGTVHLVAPEAAATSVVVVELLDRLGLPVTAEAALPLYTALVTDTGSFRHAATTPEVHRLAARLLATGLHPERVSRALWESEQLPYLHLLGEACSAAVLEPSAAAGLGLVWTCVPAAALARHGLGPADVEGVIDVVRTVGAAEVAVVIKEDPDGRAVRVSTRSRGRVDVGRVCLDLGGGGHRFAAGFTWADGADDALAVLRDRLARPEYLT